MASLHTWTGLLPGWLLFVIFLFGTVSFFQQEISQWMQPELRSAEVSPAAVDAADRILRIQAKGAESWTISLPGPRGGDGLTLSWTPRGGGRADRQERILDASTGAEVHVRDTRGGFFLYRMHFDLHYLPVMWARTLVSLAALAMLVTILSGIVTHKKIFADFFMLRFGKGQRSWLDAHNVTAVLALPFYLMITYTGLVTLLFTLMPWTIGANFPSADAFYDAAYPRRAKIEASGQAAPVIPLVELLRRAQENRPGFAPSYVSINEPGDAASVTQIIPRSDRLGRAQDVQLLRSSTGEALPLTASHGAATATRDVMVALHEGHFAGTGLRWLLFLSGVGGTAMVATGLILWTVKRRARLPDPDHPYFGFRLVERLNVGVILGAPFGIAAYFLANRLLPVDIPDRADWEINSLFIAWGAIFAWSAGRPLKAAWREGLACCSALFASVPIVNAAMTDRGLALSLADGDQVFAGFDIVMLATAAALAFAAWKASTYRPKASPRKNKPTLKEVAA